MATLLNRWPTVGIPMACPRCTSAYPCHFSSQREVTMPLDMPLTINTNIQYNLDKDKFPGLDAQNKELTLMMVPSAVIPTQTTSSQCATQTLVSTPLPSEDMQCSSGYVSEDDVICLDDQDLDTPGIVSLIDSFRESTEHLDKDEEEPCAKRRQISPVQDCGRTTCGYPSRHRGSPASQHCSRPKTLPHHAQNFCLKSSRQSVITNQSLQFPAGLSGPVPVSRTQQQHATEQGSYLKSENPQNNLWYQQWNDSQKPREANCFPVPNVSTAHHMFAPGGQTGLCEVQHAMHPQQGHSGFVRPSNLYGGFQQVSQSQFQNLPFSMQTGFANLATQRNFPNSVNWGTSVSNPIYV